MKDEWFIAQFQDITNRLARIEAKADQTNGKVKSNKEEIDANCMKIRMMEDFHLVKQTEDKFHKKHPFVTLSGISIGGVSLVTLIGLIIKVIIDML